MGSSLLLRQVQRKKIKKKKPSSEHENLTRCVFSMERWEIATSKIPFMKLEVGTTQEDAATVDSRMRGSGKQREGRKKKKRRRRDGVGTSESEAGANCFL